MSIETIHQQEIIEQNTIPTFDAYPAAAHKIASTVLTIGQLTQDFRAEKRVPRFRKSDHENVDDDHKDVVDDRENVVEHSYMLAMTALEIIQMLELDLDIGKVLRFALCHDLIELETGDVATFNLSPEKLALKEQREQAAKQKLLRRLPPGIAADFEEYEEQTSDEAIFVRTLDKLLPVALDIIGQGKRVMREDYGVTTHEEAKLAHNALHERLTMKFGERSPALIGAHAILCAIFVEQFNQ